MKDILRLVRPYQWSKNLFIFLPLFFDKQLDNHALLIRLVVVFIAFSIIASGVYCLNDLCDVKSDRMHPVKKNRPIASGSVSKRTAVILMMGCWMAGFGILYFSGNPSRFEEMQVVMIYLLMNIAYCFWIRHLAIMDVMVIAVGFVLRIWIGGVAANILLSEWIVLMTFLLALFLAFAKRRDDLVLYESTGLKMRKKTDRYNMVFMNQVLTILATITMVAYIMYTVSPEVTQRFGSKRVYLTSFFVLAGILRYLQLSLVDAKSGSPTKILMKDRFIQSCIGGWLCLFYWLIYN